LLIAPVGEYVQSLILLKKPLKELPKLWINQDMLLFHFLENLVIKSKNLFSY
jgi:hypothetical protein